MHPVRVETLDLDVLTHTLAPGGAQAPVTYPLAWAERTRWGVHVGRAFVGHPRIAFMERHVLRDLGLLVNRFTDLTGAPYARWYVDVARVESRGAVWVTRDLYLDLIEGTDGRVRLADTDEYLAGIREGHLDPDEAAFALTAFHRLVGGVFAHGDLSAWLDHEGVRLTWRGARDVTSHGPPHDPIRSGRVGG